MLTCVCACSYKVRVYFVCMRDRNCISTEPETRLLFSIAISDLQMKYLIAKITHRK